MFSYVKWTEWKLNTRISWRDSTEQYLDPTKISHYMVYDVIMVMAIGQNFWPTLWALDHLTTTKLRLDRLTFCGLLQSNHWIYHLSLWLTCPKMFLNLLTLVWSAFWPSYYSQNYSGIISSSLIRAKGTTVACANIKMYPIYVHACIQCFKCR